MSGSVGDTYGSTGQNGAIGSLLGVPVQMAGAAGSAPQTVLQAGQGAHQQIGQFAGTIGASLSANVLERADPTEQDSGLGFLPEPTNQPIGEPVSDKDAISAEENRGRRPQSDGQHETSDSRAEGPEQVTRDSALVDL